MIQEYYMDMNARLIIANNLRRLMAERQMSQMDVAKAGGVSQTSVSLALRGQKSQQIDVIEGLAHAVGVTVADLLSPGGPSGVSPDLATLLDIYAALPDEGRAQVMRVAENESRYIRR